MCMVLIGISKPGELLSNWHSELNQLLEVINIDYNRNPLLYEPNAWYVIQDDLTDELSQLLCLLKDASSITGKATASYTDQIASTTVTGNNGSVQVVDDGANIDTTSFTSVENNGVIAENIADCIQSSQQMQWSSSGMYGARPVAVPAPQATPTDLAPTLKELATWMPGGEVIDCNEVPGIVIDTDLSAFLSVGSVNVRS